PPGPSPHPGNGPSPPRPPYPRPVETVKASNQRRPNGARFASERGSADPGGRRYMPVERAQLGISASFAVGVGVVWCVFICDGAGFSYVLRHYYPRFVYLNQHASRARYGLRCAYIPVSPAPL